MYTEADPEGVVGGGAQSEYYIILTLSESRLGGTWPTFEVLGGHVPRSPLDPSLYYSI